MTVVVNKDHEQFIQQLDWKELDKLNSDINEFLYNNKEDDSEQREKTEKQLLQEDKNVKDK